MCGPTIYGLLDLQRIERSLVRMLWILAQSRAAASVCEGVFHRNFVRVFRGDGPPSGGAAGSVRMLPPGRPMQKRHPFSAGRAETDGIKEKSVCQGILRKIIGIAPRSSSFMDTQWWKPLPGKTFSSFSRSQFRHFQKTPKFRAAPIAIDMQALEKAEADAEQSKPTQERNLAAGQPGKP